MAAPYTYIKRKTEDALAAIITTFGGATLSALDQFKGVSASELTVPRIEIVAASAEPMFADSGELLHWQVEVAVTIVSHFEDAERDTHAQRSGALQDLIMTDDVQEYLNAISLTDYTVLDGLYGWEPGAMEDSVTDSEERTEANLTVRCAAFTLEDV